MSWRTTTAVLALGVLLLPIIGCGGGGGGGGGGTGTVLGRVVNDGTLQAIANATVRIATKVGVQTGADGRFQVAGVPSGNQSLTVTAGGYGTYQETIHVVAGDNDLGNVYVMPTLRAGRGAITGRVTTVSGTGIEGAQIMAGGATAVSRPGGTGQFTVYNVPTGVIQVSFYDPNTGASAWRFITVNAGLPATNVGQVALSFGPPPPPL